MVDSKNIYIGHRYVPKIFGVWNKLTSYEGLSIVTWEGVSYTSKKMVPEGVSIENEEFWAVTGNYNAQVEKYRQEVKKIDDDLVFLKDDVESKFQKLAFYVPKNAGIDEINQTIMLAYNEGGGNVYFPSGTYIIKPSQEKSIILRDNVNLIGNGNSIIKVSDNNENFDSMIKGLEGKIQNVRLFGITFDTNAQNNQSNIGLTNRRLILHAQLANNIKIEECTFMYSGMNAILMTGAMYQHKNFFAQKNYFKFSPQGTSFYDNTAMYIGVIGYIVSNNVFEGMYDRDFLKPRAVTCFEGHSSYGIFSGNIVSEYGSGVLLLGADYGTNDVLDKSLVQKNVSNNIFRKMWNGITVWAGNRDVNQFIINANIIDINNKDRNRPAQNSYGIAFTHPMGGATMRNTVKDGKVSNNKITFQYDEYWLQTHTTDENSLYMGGFGIGALGRANETVSIKNVVIEQNTITNSPRQPFVFANESVVDNQFEDIVIKRNTIINPITQIITDIDYRSLILLYGKNTKINISENYIKDDRNKNVLLKEVHFRGNLTNFNNITISKNEFENMDVGLAKDLPLFLQPPNIKIDDSNKINLFSSDNSLKNRSFTVNDVYILRTSETSNIAMCGKDGTNKNLDVLINATYKNKIISIGVGNDVPFYAGEFIEVRKKLDATIIQATVKILGVDRYGNNLIVSINGDDSVTLNYSKPAFVSINTI